jgi:hypothetical protein
MTYVCQCVEIPIIRALIGINDRVVDSHESKHSVFSCYGSYSVDRDTQSSIWILYLDFCRKLAGGRARRIAKAEIAMPENPTIYAMS